MKELNVDDLMENRHGGHIGALIDIRTPDEYNHATLPGAVNVPLFTNRERHEIGILYKQKGAKVARWEAMQTVSPKLPPLMARIRNHYDEIGRPPVIFCWRGGMRSQAVATFAEFSGIPTLRLVGGYKAYRKWVLAALQPDLVPSTVVVLHGMTGVGKTDILHHLETRNVPILDLEKLAGHRGSVFGDIGDTPSNQKMFDSHLYDQLQKLHTEPFFVMEAENKRIGRCSQPDFLLQAKNTGLHINVQASMAVRVERILQDYVRPYQHEPWFEPYVERAVSKIEKRLSPTTRQDIRTLIRTHEYAHLIERLLADYYDPRYLHKKQAYEGRFETVNGDDPQTAASAIQTLFRDHGLL